MDKGGVPQGMRMKGVSVRLTDCSKARGGQAGTSLKAASPSKPLVLKFVDGSGTDITEQVKETAGTKEEEETKAEEEETKAGAEETKADLVARLNEDFAIQEEETDDSDVRIVEVLEEEEVLEVAIPKVQEVLIVLDEEERSGGFDCILEKVEDSPVKVVEVKVKEVEEVKVKEVVGDVKVKVVEVTVKEV